MHTLWESEDYCGCGWVGVTSSGRFGLGASGAAGDKVLPAAFAFIYGYNKNNLRCGSAGGVSACLTFLL